MMHTVVEGRTCTAISLHFTRLTGLHTRGTITTEGTDYHRLMCLCRMFQVLEKRLQQEPLKVSKSRAQAFVATLRKIRKHDSSTRYTLEPLFEMCRLLCVPAAKVCPLPLGRSFAISPLFPCFPAATLGIIRLSLKCPWLP